MSFLSKNGWGCVVFVKKCVGVGRFCQKMGGSRLCFLKNWVVVGHFS